MPVISVRLEESDEKWLRKRGLKPGAFARAAVHEQIRLQEIRGAREFLDAHSFVAEVDAVAFFRQERESH